LGSTTGDANTQIFGPTVQTLNSASGPIQIRDASGKAFNTLRQHGIDKTAAVFANRNIPQEDKDSEAAQAKALNQTLSQWRHSHMLGRHLVAVNEQGEIVGSVLGRVDPSDPKAFSVDDFGFPEDEEQSRAVEAQIKPVLQAALVAALKGDAIQQANGKPFEALTGVDRAKPWGQESDPEASSVFERDGWKRFAGEAQDAVETKPVQQAYTGSTGQPVDGEAWKIDLAKVELTQAPVALASGLEERLPLATEIASTPVARASIARQITEPASVALQRAVQAAIPRNNPASGSGGDDELPPDLVNRIQDALDALTPIIRTQGEARLEAVEASHFADLLFI